MVKLDWFVGLWAMAAKTAEGETCPESEGVTVPKIREPDRRLFLAKNPFVVPPTLVRLLTN